MSFNIEVKSGKSVRLPTAGKYCDRDIVVTATSASEEELKAKYDEGVQDGVLQLLSGLIVGGYYNDQIESIVPYGFGGQSSLVSAELPNLTDAIGGSVFVGCENLESVKLPAYAGNTNGYFFDGDKKLQFVDFGYAAKISIRAFRNCNALKTLVLRRSELVTLNSTNGFEVTNEETASSPVTVYVPSALINKYKLATNWSPLRTSGRVTFQKLEGSEYE